jgi:aryl-alcohol dehydrogenase-like predicted oxidoreductase
MIGRWLVERDPAVAGRVRLATKVAPPYVDGPGGRFDAAFLEAKFSGSLQRLGVDSVELLLTHAPDDGTPIEETLEGVEAIRARGRCRVVGACNVDTGQLTAALDAAERLGISGYQVVQNSYSLLRPDDERAVRSICAERDLAFTPYSPLAGGALTGKYRRDALPPPESRMALRPDGVDEMLTPAVHDAIDRLRYAAEGRHGVECGTLALAWLLHHREVTAPVIGPARRSPHLELAARASRSRYQTRNAPRSNPGSHRPVPANSSTGWTHGQPERDVGRRACCWLEQSRRDLAAEHARATGSAPDVSVKHARLVVGRQLPDGHKTEGHSFWWIVDDGRRVSHLCLGPAPDDQVVFP